MRVPAAAFALMFFSSTVLYADETAHTVETIAQLPGWFVTLTSNVRNKMLEIGLNFPNDAEVRVLKQPRADAYDVDVSYDVDGKRENFFAKVALYDFRVLSIATSRNSSLSLDGPLTILFEAK